MKIYTILEDEAFEYEKSQRTRGSFKTREAALNHIEGIKGDIINHWKTLDNFNSFDDMDTEESDEGFEIWVDGRYLEYHTTLTILESEIKDWTYDKNGYLSSAVKIIPDDSYIGYHYGKPKRV